MVVRSVCGWVGERVRGYAWLTCFAVLYIYDRDILFARSDAPRSPRWSSPPVLSPSRERAVVWGERGATARPREAKWSSGVAAILGVYYNRHVFRDPFGHRLPGTLFWGICVCIIAKFSSSFEHLFVRALFGKTLSTPTREARPDTLVEV